MTATPFFLLDFIPQICFILTMRDKIIELQDSLKAVANDCQSAVFGEFPDGYKAEKGKKREKVYCLEVDEISRQAQILIARLGKLTERIDGETGK